MLIFRNIKVVKTIKTANKTRRTTFFIESFYLETQFGCERLIISKLGTIVKGMLGKTYQMSADKNLNIY